MRIAYVSAAAIATEGHSFLAADYLQPTVQQEQRLKAARRKIQEGLAGIAKVARERREIRARQKRLGIKEVTHGQYP